MLYVIALPGSCLVMILFWRASDAGSPFLSRFELAACVKRPFSSAVASVNLVTAPPPGGCCDPLCAGHSCTRRVRRTNSTAIHTSSTARREANGDLSSAPCRAPGAHSAATKTHDAPPDAAAPTAPQLSTSCACSSTP